MFRIPVLIAWAFVFFCCALFLPDVFSEPQSQVYRSPNLPPSYEEPGAPTGSGDSSSAQDRPEIEDSTRAAPESLADVDTSIKGLASDAAPTDQATPAKQAMPAAHAAEGDESALANNSANANAAIPESPQAPEASSHGSAELKIGVLAEAAHEEAAPDQASHEQAALVHANPVFKNAYPRLDFAPAIVEVARMADAPSAEALARKAEASASEPLTRTMPDSASAQPEGLGQLPLDQAALEQAAPEQAALVPANPVFKNAYPRLDFTPAIIEGARMADAPSAEAAATDPLARSIPDSAATQPEGLGLLPLDQAAHEQAALEQAALEQAALVHANPGFKNAYPRLDFAPAIIEGARMADAPSAEALARKAEAAATEPLARTMPASAAAQPEGLGLLPLDQAAHEQAALEQAALEQAALVHANPVFKNAYPRLDFAPAIAEGARMADAPSAEALARKAEAAAAEALARTMPDSASAQPEGLGQLPLDQAAHEQAALAPADPTFKNAYPRLDFAPAIAEGARMADAPSAEALARKAESAAADPLARKAEAAATEPLARTMPASAAASSDGLASAASATATTTAAASAFGKTASGLVTAATEAPSVVIPARMVTPANTQSTGVAATNTGTEQNTPPPAAALAAAKASTATNTAASAPTPGSPKGPSSAVSAAFGQVPANPVPMDAAPATFKNPDPNRFLSIDEVEDYLAQLKAANKAAIAAAMKKQPGKISGKVSPARGAMISLGDASIDIPGGALTTAGTVCLEELRTEVELDAGLVNVTSAAFAYVISPGDAKLFKPALLTLPFDRSVLASDAALSGLASYMYDPVSQKWLRLETVSINREAATITSKTLHFSQALNATQVKP